jgi:hypothetical protein
MNMSQVIYLPSERSQTLGGDIGGLLGAVIGSSMREKARKQQQEEAMQFMEALRKAPNRAAGMEVISNYHPKFKTPQDFAQSFKMLDEFHPVSMETPSPIPAWDAATGEKSTVFANRRQMVDPNFWKGQGKTLTEVQMDNFYMPDPNAKPGAEPQPTHLGRFPISRRAELPPTAMTDKEWAMAQAGRKDVRAEKADVRAEEGLRLRDEAGQRAQESLNASQERQARMMAGIAARLGESEGVHAQKVVRDTTNYMAMVLGAKMLGDTFDFTDTKDGDNKRKILTDMTTAVTTRIDANPKILKDASAVNKLGNEALKAYAGDILTPKKASTVETPPEKGGISKLWDKVTGGGKDPNMSSVDTRNKKGTGYLGELQRPDGKVSTEISVDVNIDGRKVAIPTLVPTLTHQEVNQLLSMKDGDAKAIPKPIIDKAVAFAKQRMAVGKSPFADASESPRGKPSTETLSPTERTASLASAKDTAAKIRDSDLPQLEKKKRLDTIRSRLRAVGIKEDI